MHLVMRNFNVDPENSAKIASSLIKKGCNLHVLNCNQLTPMHVALYYAQNEAIKFALCHNYQVRRLRRHNFQSHNLRCACASLSCSRLGNPSRWGVFSCVLYRKASQEKIVIVFFTPLAEQQRPSTYTAVVKTPPMTHSHTKNALPCPRAPVHQSVLGSFY